MSEPVYSEHICKSCGHTFVGLYCNLCGEKVIEPKDRQFKTAFTSVMIATSIVDNKFIRNMRLVLGNPGFLSREYVDGRRVRYMRPLQMFFILNLIYFLFPVLQMFNSSYYTQTHVLPHSRFARELIAAKIKAEHMTPLGFELLYNDKTNRMAKLMMVVFVFLASLPLSLIFARRNRFFSDHLALSIELSSFNLAVNAILLSLLLWLIHHVLHWSHAGGSGYLNDLTLTIIFVLTNLYFLFRAARTFYQQKGKRLMIKACLGIVGLFLALEAYRFVLLLITLWTL